MTLPLEVWPNLPHTAGDLCATGAKERTLEVLLTATPYRLQCIIEQKSDALGDALRG
jgi:hypothetical protein